MENETKIKPIELLFNQLKSQGKFPMYRDYADYRAQRRLEIVREPAGLGREMAPVATSGKIKRPMFGYQD